MNLATEALVQDQVSLALDEYETSYQLRKDQTLLGQLFDEIDLLEDWKRIVKTYGLTNQFKDIVDHDRKFSSMTGIDIDVATATDIIGATEGIIRKTWDAILNLFRSLLERLKKFFGVRKAIAARVADINKEKIATLEKQEYSRSALAEKVVTAITMSEYAHLKQVAMKCANYCSKLKGDITAASDEDFALSKIGVSAWELIHYIGLRMDSQKKHLVRDMSQFIEYDTLTLTDMGFHGRTDLAKLREYGELGYEVYGLTRECYNVAEKLTNQVTELMKKYPDPADLPDDKKEFFKNAGAWSASAISLCTQTYAIASTVSHDIIAICNAIHACRYKEDED